MQSRLLFIAMALALGAVLPMQAAINSRLAKTAGNPVMAAFVSFAVGTIALMILFNHCGPVSIPICFYTITLVDLDRRFTGNFFCCRNCDSSSQTRCGFIV